MQALQAEAQGKTKQGYLLSKAGHAATCVAEAQLKAAEAYTFHE